MKYTMIRGDKQRERCTDPIKGRLYCDCGCQVPQSDDLQPNLSDLLVTGRAEHGYADYTLVHRSTGKRAGEINTQYCALVVDGYELIGCDRAELAPILNQIFDGDKNRFSLAPVTGAGDTLEETAATVRIAEKLAEMEQDERNKHHPGWCLRCHSYCYGDCTA